VIDGIRRVLPRQIEQRFEPIYRKVGRRMASIDRTFDRRTMSPEGFAGLMVELGVTSGATALIHSSMDEIARRVPQLTPVRVIELLQRLLGPEGTLVMATFPFLGRQLDYVMTHRTFHPQKTPSQVGLITETFRRMPGVIRSLHPTHPVAAWGKHARDLTSSHHLGTTFGENSPFFKLQKYGGLVIGVGTRLRRFTILHVPEELHAKTRQFVFESTPRVINMVHGETEFAYPLFAMCTDVQRNYDRVEKLLLRDGTLKYLDRNGLKCAVAQAERIIRRSLDLIDKNLYLFN
jgi:aminoglycoside 3-N-acetyltransferase